MPHAMQVAALLFLGIVCSVPATSAATVNGTVMLVSAETRLPRKGDWSAVVVWLEPVSNTGAPAEPTAEKHVAMDQRNKTFVPHVLAIQVGTTVDFPNDDPIDHNVFSNYDGQIFDVHLYSPQTSKRVVFRRPGIVHVFCNIHDTMSGVIAVLATPYFAVTAADGRYAIDAPLGDYRLHFWQEYAEPDALAKLERSVRVGDQAVTIAEETIAVRAVSVVDHKDKYGHDYHVKPPEYIFYPGVRR